MRGFHIFGGARRNDPIRLEDPHPIEKYEDPQHSGSPVHDGYTLLSKANPKAQGSAPPVAGTLGREFQGPDESFEQ